MTEAVRKHPLPPRDVTVTSLEKARVSPPPVIRKVSSGLDCRGLHSPIPRPNCHQVEFPYLVYKVVVADIKGIVSRGGSGISVDNEVFLGYARIILRIFPLLFTVRRGRFFSLVTGPCFPLVGDLQIVGKII
jgi:hypothetical protein